MKTKVLLMVLLLAGGGCLTEPAYWNQVDDVVVTPVEFKQLPPEEQVKYEPVEIQQIDPDVAIKVDAGITATQGAVQVIKPFIPEPFATGAVAILGGLASLWMTIKQVKTKNILDRVKLGAVITAQSIDTVVRPTAEMMNTFRERQKSKSANTNAIMPDEIAIKI